MNGWGRAVLAMVVGALIGGCGGGDEAPPAEAGTPERTATATATPTPESYASQYDGGDRKIWMAVCTSDGESRPYCACVYEHMSEHVPYEEFLGGEDLSAKGNEELFAAVEACS